jgi:hypothetical protein
MASKSNAGIPNTPYLIDATASAEMVAEAIESGAVLELGVPSMPGLVINGSRKRARASFGESFLTVFPEGLVFAVEHLTHRELRVFALLTLVQEFGDTQLPLRVSDIAARLRLTPSAVSRAVARMHALGILRPGRAKDGQSAGLRISRRVLFRGNAFHYCELGQDPPLSDPDEAPIIQRMRRRPLLPPARGALVATRRSARSGSGSKSGGGHERSASGSVERPDGGAAGAGAEGGTRGRPGPAPSRSAHLPDEGAGGVSGDPASLSAGVA